MREVTTLSPRLKSLKDEFLRRCCGIAEQLSASAGLIGSEVMNSLRIQYLAPLKRPTKAELEEELHLITVMSVVIDLIGQGWNFDSTGPEVCLFFERNESVALDKERIRRAHLLDRDTQLSEPSVAQFIKNMEKRRLTERGWHSIFSVMRDGELLASELSEVVVHGADSDDLAGFESCISPYLQFVTPEAICEHTGLRLNDIWRYFRHTWVNSYRSVPGRSMMILVRDAAGPNHPVIGIAALGSSVVQSSVRDRWIGWDAEGTCEKLGQMKAKNAAAWLLERTASLIKDVYVKDLLRDGVLTLSEINRPTKETLRRLEHDSETAIKQHRLYPLAAKQNESVILTARGWKERAETALFRSKRAKQLSRLLKIRQTLQLLGVAESIKPQLWRQILQSAQFRATVGQLIRSVKAERVGINMMDITVCGAVAPYNHLLGGKLTCMLLCSPEVSRECARRYGEHISIIASAMRGKPVQREASLALLCTTSLYGSGLSQYSRVKIPAVVTGGRDGSKIEYRELGVSEGFGSFHFSKDTLRLFGMVLGRAQHARKVNSIFGEGVNPLMRKIRDAMAILGLPAEALLRHGNRRVVYGVSLADNTSRFLSGFDRRVRFSLPQSRPTERTSDIARYWSTRWLRNRLQKPGILDEVSNHRLTYPVRHGARVEVPNEQVVTDAVLFDLT
jgi:Domain of unknown function (DUF4338)